MSNEKIDINWSLILFFIATTLILINFTSLWLTTRELSVGKEVFYWQKFNNYLSGAWYLSCFSTPIVLGMWLKVGIDKFRYSIFLFLLSIAFCFGFVTLDYFSVFALKFVDHVKTIELKGNVYQVAKVSNYDNGTTYYLGECDQSGYTCVFHVVYRYYSEYRDTPVSVNVEHTENELQLLMNGEIVYIFDGTNENCVSAKQFIGYCLIYTP